jgi:hypothetical protein
MRHMTESKKNDTTVNNFLAGFTYHVRRSVSWKKLSYNKIFTDPHIMPRRRPTAEESPKETDRMNDFPLATPGFSLPGLLALSPSLPPYKKNAFPTFRNFSFLYSCTDAPACLIPMQHKMASSRKAADTRDLQDPIVFINFTAGRSQNSMYHALDLQDPKNAEKCICQILSLSPAFP